MTDQGVAFAREGELLTFSTVRVPRPGIEAPYTLGQVRLDDGPTLFTHIRNLPEAASVPLRVRLVLGEPGATPSFWFCPLELS